MADKLIILLVNRDEEFMEATAKLLSQAGYATLMAMELRGALSVLSANKVDLILCDRNLREITGYQFLRYLKSDPQRESIPFVFFVPLNEQRRKEQALAMGAKDFLLYPLEAEAFLARLQSILNVAAPPAPVTPTVPETPAVPKAPPIPAAEAVPPAPPSISDSLAEDRRHTDRSRPLPSLNIEVSRDGFLWMPGHMKNYSSAGILVETAMLSKPGGSLIIRCRMPEGPVTVKGRVIHVGFDDLEQPVGMGIHFEDLSAWPRVFEYLNVLTGQSVSTPSAEPPPEGDSKLHIEIPKAPSLSRRDDAALDLTIVMEQPQVKEDSYNTRFYHSLVGKQLDNYTVVSFLGSGSMGGVFKGWDTALEREAALKVISFELSSQENFVEMFIKEARFVSKLNHPNIAQIYYIGNTNNILYYAMEFISGHTLSQLIRKHGHLNSMKSVNYFITVCSTLDFVLKKNIIHRDIKPENILINEKGVVKIVDFGVAKHMDTSSSNTEEEDMIVGSPRYLSPEPILGRTVDHRSDIYSLGATFYHVFSGTPPYDGRTVKDILHKHIHDKLMPLKERNPKVPTPICTIIEKMLEKDPDHRYQNYQEIVRDLQAFRSRVLKTVSKGIS